MKSKMTEDIQDFIVELEDFEIKEGMTQDEVLKKLKDYLQKNKDVEIPVEVYETLFGSELDNEEIEIVEEKKEEVKETPKKANTKTVKVKCSKNWIVNFSFGEFDFTSGEADIPEEFAKMLCDMEPYSYA